MPRNPDNPLLRSARREASWTVAIWFCALVYTVGYCAYRGYGREFDTLSFVFGFPDWVFWGIMAPWGVCYAISALFAFVVMQDAPLEDDAEVNSAAGGEIAHD
jgi:uncharacterized membrane protein YhdT